MLRCPLCLQQIADGSQIVRYCRRHPAQGRNVVISTADFSGIGCSGNTDDDVCEPSMAIDDGVFLFHVGCPCTSPFLMPTREVNVSNRRRLANGTFVDHWQIEKAEEIATVHAREEMWFPQALFRAANEAVDGRPLGCLVMLAGAQSAGKTVLSLMSMNHLSYPEQRFVQHYAHITEAGASNEDMLVVFHALNQFRRGTTDQTMLPTAAAHLTNIKSVFLPVGSTAAASRRSHEGRLGIGDVFGVIGRMLFNRNGARHRQPLPPTHTVVAFYDLSGELWQRATALRTLDIRANADVQAIVLDMTAFQQFNLPSAHHANIAVAREQLERASISSGPRCLVVTKIDEVVATVSGTATGMSALRSFFADLKERMIQRRPPDSAHYRQFLCGVLANSPNVMEQRLWQRIMSDRDLEVFFVWTEGLGQSQAQVQSYGIEPFIDWCLERTTGTPALRGA